jgi:hypothetical protein
MVNGEQSLSQCIIGLPFTVHCLPHALRSALGALRQGAVQSRVFVLGFFTGGRDQNNIVATLPLNSLI